jgi:hypothetical protein
MAGVGRVDSSKRTRYLFYAAEGHVDYGGAEEQQGKWQAGNNTLRQPKQSATRFI